MSSFSIFVLINEKGGVGKSTDAISIAAGFAIRGKRVLIIDADPQANTTEHFAIKPIEGLFRVVAQDAEWASVSQPIVPQLWAGMAYKLGSIGRLSIVPGHETNRLIPLAVDDSDKLAERLDELRPYVDVVVIDTSPTPSMIHAMLYRAATHILVPTNFEKWGVTGMSKTIARIKKEQASRSTEGLPPLNFLGIISNMEEKHTIAHKTGREATLKAFGQHPLITMPKRTIWREFAWSPNERTIFAYAPGSDAEADAWALVNYCLANLATEEV